MPKNTNNCFDKLKELEYYLVDLLSAVKILRNVAKNEKDEQIKTVSYKIEIRLNDVYEIVYGKGCKKLFFPCPDSKTPPEFK